MGFLKKIFKPVSKVLDKIIPNEVKPFLPYAAAFAPMLMPATGFMGSMMGRGLMSGGANIFAQLAQEGNEGDINELSALLAGGIGALSAPGSTGGRTLPDGSGGSYSQVMTGGDQLASVGNQSAGEYLRGLSNSGGIGDKALNFLGQGADKLSGINAAGAADPFSMAGLKAAAIPLSQGTGDLMYQEGVNAQRDYEKALLDYENSLAEGQFASDSGRREAIINAMTGNHTQEVIDQTLAELGLRNGGRVNAMNGGIMSNQRMNFRGGGMDYMPTEPEIMGNPAVMEMILPGDDMRENRIMNSDVEDVADYKGFYERKNNPENYDEQGFKIKEEIKEPNFGGIEEAVESIDEKEFYENGSGNSLLDKVAVLFIDEKGDWRSGLQRAKYELSEFISGKGFDLTTGAEWYNKLPLDVQREILEEKIKYREMRPDSDEERREFTMSDGTIKKGARMYPKSITEMPVYDEADAGKFGYGAAMANGGIMNGYNMGGSVLPQGMEMDYRGGGFIPMGSKERADDVPARVSKNEFVMTADAVRAAGGGSVNQGAKKMYDLMNNLEARA
jgi:hypothetical protein